MNNIINDLFLNSAPLDNTSFARRKRIFLPENDALRPHELSMDWLNNRLYILFAIEVGVSDTIPIGFATFYCIDE